MQYKSIQQYLDAVFGTGANPPEEDIVQAKKQYYKLWHRQYNRERRKRRKEFTLGFDPQTLKRIKEQKGTLSVSKYLYKVVFNALDDGVRQDFDNGQLVAVHQKLMQLIALVEQVLEGGEHPPMETIIERIEELELQFSKLTP